LETTITIRLGRDLGDLFPHGLHDAGVGLDQIVPAHARLARDAGSDHEDFGAFGGRVIVGSDDPGVVAFDGTGLPLIEALALGHSLDHIHHDHSARELLLGQLQRRRGSDVARAYNGDLIQHRSRPSSAKACRPQMTPINK
jgi:hypothetical protein